MQKVEIYIEGEALELSDQTRIGITYQANNIGELQKRQGNFTNTFKIPLTLSNMSALQWSNVISSNTSLPYTKSGATYIEEGIEIISDGEAIIQKVDQDFIFINIVSGNVDLAKAIGDLIVGDLYIGEAFDWNIGNVFNSRWSLTYYIFPFIDWRTDKDTYLATAEVDAREMLPCVVIPEMFTRLEAFTGYQFTGDYLQSLDHSKMILTPDEFTIKDENLEDQTLKSSKVTIAEIHPIDSSSSWTLIPEGTGSITEADNPNTHNVFDTGFSGGVYYPLVNERVVFQYVATIGINWIRDEFYGFGESELTRRVDVVAKIWQFDGVSTTTLLAQKAVGSQSGTLSDFNPAREDFKMVCDIKTPKINIVGGYQYYVEILATYERHDNIDSRARIYATDSQDEFRVIPDSVLVFENPLDFSDLFRMSVKDVLKDILNLRGIIIQTNSYTKEVQFNFFQDLISNKSIAKDWSSKVDVRSHQMAFRFGKYGQVNNFLFSERDDVPNGLGDYYFNLSDETLDDEVDVVKMKHPATVEENRYLGVNVPKIEGIDQDNAWNKPDWRLLQLDTRDSFSINYTDGVNNTATTSTLPFAEFIGFDELVPEFYQALTGILDKTKAITLIMKLTAVDIQKLDFSIPIFLDVPDLDLHAYFYINKISNYKQGFTPVEFVRL